MRIVRYHDPSGLVHYGDEQSDGRIQPLSGSPLDPLRPLEKVDADPIELGPGQRLAPVLPTNIFCIGLNYREHAREGGAEIPTHPVVFMKPTTAVHPPDQPIKLPSCQMNGPEIDYECELAVVIGKPTRNVSEKDALDHVLGYTAANDVSARRWQKHGGGGQWVRGKSFDTFCPLGPVLVTADEIPDPQTLGLRTILNGKVMQDHTTSDMIFTVAFLIHFLSQDVTLLPGTVILTGTPHGVGVARDPQVFLKAGDTVTIQVDKIGELTNPVVDA